MASLANKSPPGWLLKMTHIDASVASSSSRLVSSIIQSPARTDHVFFGTPCSTIKHRLAAKHLSRTSLRHRLSLNSISRLKQVNQCHASLAPLLHQHLPAQGQKKTEGNSQEESHRQESHKTFGFMGIHKGITIRLPSITAATESTMPAAPSRWVLSKLSSRLSILVSCPMPSHDLEGDSRFEDARPGGRI